MPYQVNTEFKGYRAKEDITKLPPGFMVPGSQNVLTNEGERIAVRRGYTLDGQENTALTPIVSSFDWKDRPQAAQYLRSYDDELEYRYVDSTGAVTWRRLADGFTSVAFNYAAFWDTTELIERLLFVNGSSNIYDWSGAVTTLSSVSNTALNIVGNNALLTSAPLSTASTHFTIYSNGLAGTSFQSSLVFASQPANGDVLNLNYNGGGATVQFVTVIGAVEGNVLIGATLADTLTNLLGLLQNPATTSATQVAFSVANQTRVGYTTSSDTDTITKSGTSTWAEDGFYTTGTRQIVMDGITYTYTGGEGTTTLTGVTPDPTLGAHAAGAIIHQAIRTTANGGGLPAAFSNDLIAVLYNYVYVGSFSNRRLYVSQQNSFTTWTFATPRTPGQGAILTIDATPKALISQEDSMYISAGTDQWYKVTLQLSDTQTNEVLFVQRLKTTEQQGAHSQAYVGKDRNSVIFLSKYPTIETLGRIELVQDPQNTNISDPVKNLFDVLDFDDGCIAFHRDSILVAVPAEGLVLIYNVAKGWWEAPQILPVSRFAIIGGELYGHSSEVPETYKLFTGYSDRSVAGAAGNPIDARAHFSYQSMADRPDKKNFNEFYTEGYISANTTLTMKILFDYFGYNGSTTQTISGDPTNPYIFVPTDDGSLGVNSLAIRSLAGRGSTADETLPNKFRIVNTFPQVDFYEYQPQYSSNGIDQRWEILGSGPSAMASTQINTEIQK